MENIIRHTGTNIGGNSPVYIAFKEEVLAYAYDPSTLDVQCTLSRGSSWYNLYATPETLKIESDSQESESGVNYSYKMTFLVPKDRQEVEVALRQLAGRGLIVRATDKNGVERVFGNPENPMRVISKILKPASVAEYNGWEVTISGTFGHPAGYFISSEYVEPGVDPR